LIETRRLYSTPREICDKSHAFIIGSTGYVSSIDFSELSTNKSRSSSSIIHRLEMHDVKLELIIEHLKCLVTCYKKCSPSEQRTETSSYIKTCQRIYDALMLHNNPNDIVKKMRSLDLIEWIWNGVNGFASANRIYLIDKTHPLAAYVKMFPYELSKYQKFFEAVGVKHQPDPMELQEILRSQQQQQTIDERLLKWIREKYADDRLLKFIYDIESKTIGKSNGKSKSMTDDQTRITFTSTLDLADDKVYLYLSGKSNDDKAVHSLSLIFNE
jgi:hypothetical protein